MSWRNNRRRSFGSRWIIGPARLRRAVGLALRWLISGPFHPSDERARWLADLAASLLEEAAANRLQVAELQIDFDCAGVEAGRLPGLGGSHPPPGGAG